MATHNFYITNSEIAEKSNDCLHGAWDVATSTAIIVFLMCILPIIPAVLLAIYVAWWLAIPLGIITLFVWAIMSYGFSNVCLKIAKEETPTKKDVFAGFSRKMGSILGILIKRIFLSIFWLIILVIPCAVKNISYTMSYMLLADKSDVTSENAVKLSKHLMQQNIGRYFKLILRNTFWYLLILITVGISWIWIGPLLRTKKAVFYEDLKTEF